MFSMKSFEHIASIGINIVLILKVLLRTKVEILAFILKDIKANSFDVFSLTVAL